MIKNYFSFIRGIGKKTEQKFFKQGICSWEDFLKQDNASGTLPGISSKKKKEVDEHLSNMQKAVYTFDLKYLCRTIPQKEHWRLYDFFRDDCIFLDIEAGRVKRYGNVFDEMFLIGVYNNYEYKAFVKGINLDLINFRNMTADMSEIALDATCDASAHSKDEQFLSMLKNSALKYRACSGVFDISKHKMVVSFNGSVFDIPKINKYFEFGLKPKAYFPDILHFDLRFACRKLGISGGLKQAEKFFGIKRQNKIVEGIGGGDPFELWKIYCATGDEHYLNLLLEYNEEDVVNLKFLADRIFSLLKEKELERMKRI